MNQKSIDSYQKLLFEKVITRRQSQVLEVIEKSGKRGVTNRTIAAVLDWDINRVTGRVKELRDKSLVMHAGDHFDEVTQRTVNKWKLSKDHNL